MSALSTTPRESLRIAMEVEALKLRRSVVARVVTAVLLVIVPAASIGAVALARSPHLPGEAAAKFAPFASGDLALASLQVCGQILAVAVVAAGGFAVAWTFGRELAEGTAGALFGLAVPRTAIACAKALLTFAWLSGCVAVCVLITLAGAAIAGGHLNAVASRAAGLALGAGLLAAGLALPFGWVATVTRSPFGTIGVLIGLVAVTQVVVVLGAGAWFPYAVPSLWTGAGGPQAAGEVTVGALCLTAAVAPAAVVAMVRSWQRLTDV